MSGVNGSQRVTVFVAEKPELAVAPHLSLDFATKLHWAFAACGLELRGFIVHKAEQLHVPIAAAPAARSCGCGGDMAVSFIIGRKEMCRDCFELAIRHKGEPEQFLEAGPTTVNIRTSGECEICGAPTELACMDCIADHGPVYVCAGRNGACRDAHELHEHGGGEGSQP